MLIVASVFLSLLIKSAANRDIDYFCHMILAGTEYMTDIKKTAHDGLFFMLTKHTK